MKAKQKPQPSPPRYRPHICLRGGIWAVRYRDMVWPLPQGQSFKTRDVPEEYSLSAEARSARAFAMRLNHEQGRVP